MSKPEDFAPRPSKWTGAVSKWTRVGGPPTLHDLRRLPNGQGLGPPTFQIDRAVSKWTRVVKNGDGLGAPPPTLHGAAAPQPSKSTGALSKWTRVAGPPTLRLEAASKGTRVGGPLSLQIDKG